ncbi:MAG TPA: hypothetical protein VFY65_18600 [Longimicrobium sp.]|nr:hypothetical protein [Longimicrobium sp.]
MTTSLTSAQVEIPRLMRDAAAGDARIICRSEYSSWLPFGQYHGIEVARPGAERPVPLGLPGGWVMADILAIEQAGRLRRVSQKHVVEFDEDEIIYELAEGE